jgi:uncharacterized membrane protein YeiB
MSATPRVASGAAAGAGPRLEGLDLARWLALAGMVFVNFKQAMHPAEPGPGWLQAIFQFLEGKASATFVVLAGLGLVLATRALDARTARLWTLRRALFLLVAGLANLWIFVADIIHYYAVYFALATLWLKAGRAALVAGMAGTAALSCWALLRHDYGQGWDWSTLGYAGLWEPAGFVRNLVFNGFHPVLPWFALCLLGMLLATLPLQRPRTQWLLLAGGALLAVLGGMLSWLGSGTALAPILGTGPMPPGPAYVLTGMGWACMAIGACLRWAALRPHGSWTGLLPAGRMTLSLYLAHILIGMGLLEALGALDGSRSLAEVAVAAALYLVLATVAARAWSRRAAQGPVEMLMRRMTALQGRRTTS